MQVEVKEYKLKILEIIDEAKDTKTFRVENPKVDFLPGQFFMVRFEDDEVLKRPYSVASSPMNKEYMDIAMNLVGEFTGKLWECKVGNCLYFKGPYGKFHFNDEDKDLVLIGGGLGITPLMSIIRHCKDKKLKNKINLVYSVKTAEDIVYLSEIEELNKDNFDFDAVITVTRDGSGWKGRMGRIDEELLKQNIRDIGNSLFFICGSLGFARDMTAKLEALGAGKEQIRKDVWGNYENGV